MPKKILKKNYLKKKLDKTKFKNIKIIQCNFWEASLKNSLFENVEILDSVFTDADLSGAKFSNTTIKNSNFSHAIITGCDFSKCKFVNINLREAIYDSKTRWPKNFHIKNKKELQEINKFNPYNYDIKIALNNVKKITSKKLLEYKNKLIKKVKVNKKDNTSSKLEKKIIYELTKGKGYFIIKNYYKKKDINLAEKLIINRIKLTNNYKKVIKSYSVDKRLRYINIYGLLNINKIFQKMLQPIEAMNAFKKLLGKNFYCTWYAAQCSMPECRGQNLHLDYPYVSYNYPGENIPVGMGSKDFLLSCTLLTYLHESDESNYGPIVLKNSHKLRMFPTLEHLKKKKFIRLQVPRGGILILNSLIWHAGMPNYSKKKIRTILLASYSSEFVKPRYNLKKETKPSILKNDTGYLKQLISN